MSLFKSPFFYIIAYWYCLLVPVIPLWKNRALVFPIELPIDPRAYYEWRLLGPIGPGPGPGPWRQQPGPGRLGSFGFGRNGNNENSGPTIGNSIGNAIGNSIGNYIKT